MPTQRRKRAAPEAARNRNKVMTSGSMTLDRYTSRNQVHDVPVRRGTRKSHQVVEKVHRQEGENDQRGGRSHLSDGLMVALTMARKDMTTPESAIMAVTVSKPTERAA